jgi:hypothetical protein
VEDEERLALLRHLVDEARAIRASARAERARLVAQREELRQARIRVAEERRSGRVSIYP